jgi:hypothetical protein
MKIEFKRSASDVSLLSFLAQYSTDWERLRKNWPRLIRKIYEVDPLICLKCNGQMRIVSFIEDQVVISKILKHLGLHLVVQNALPGLLHPESPGWMTHTFRFRSRMTISTQILTTLLMTISPDSNKRKGSKGVGALEFP